MSPKSIDLFTTISRGCQKLQRVMTRGAHSEPLGDLGPNQSMDFYHPSSSTMMDNGWDKRKETPDSFTRIQHFFKDHLVNLVICDSKNPFSVGGLALFNPCHSAKKGRGDGPFTSPRFGDATR